LDEVIVHMHTNYYNLLHKFSKFVKKTKLVVITYKVKHAFHSKKNIAIIIYENTMVKFQ
jgi:hypothetical protein